jgi:two-component system cell cycle response regulator
MRQSLTQILGRALVMDSDRARSAWNCARLTSAGWQTLQAADAAEALAAVNDGDVDVALLHLAADEAQATDLPRVLRLAAEVPHMPVVVLAPAPPEQTRCQFLDSGADEIVPDDISPVELAARLRALMRVKALQDQLHASREALSASLARERALLTQVRRDNAHLMTLCSTDPLTHLYNVRHFDSRRYRRHLSLLAFDLDHFKVVNDAHGHPSGDYVLKEFAVILRRCVRDSDVVARTGGEEFSIILPNAGRSQARRLAQRIRRTVSQRKFAVYGQSIHVTTSIGSASYPQDVEITSPHMLTYFADQALLRAKQLGRNRVASVDELDPSERRNLREAYWTATPGGLSDEPRQAAVADARR